jgi:5,10-methylenetetrahydromethanopterin reductase
MTAPPRTGVWVFPNQPASELVDVIVEAEALGIDEFWLGDEGPAREPITILGAAATRTGRIRLATGITNPYVRHPVITTSSMLTIHELSGGRAILGVGAGGHMSLAPLGLTADKPLGAVADFITTARAVCEGEAAHGYEPPDYAITSALAGAPMPLYVGARGERLNRLASEVADGAFVAGMPPFRYDDVIGWARSLRPIEIALCPSVAFTEDDIERHRPEMIWSLHDTPAAVRAELGLDIDEVRAAAEALRAGDTGPAIRILDDELLEKVMLLGRPEVVGARLAELVVRHRPDSIGLALILDDLAEGVRSSAAAFAAMAERLTREQEQAI